MSQKHESNRQAWNEAATYYRSGLEDGIQLLKNGGKHFCQPELEFLKDLVPQCGRAIHLQCAGGTDTLSLINLGIKEVVGVDISEEMIAVAREKSERLGMNASWVVSDVLNVPHELEETADLVYSGRGAVNWIMDLDAWARSIARLLKPNGHFYFFEGHPVTYFFEMKSTELKLDPEFEGYFADKTYQSQSWPETYVGKVKSSENEQTVKYEKAWPVSQVVTALLNAGLTLKRFEEHPDAYWSEFPNMPEETRRKFPNTYSLLLKKER